MNTAPLPRAKNLHLPWWYWVANLAMTGIVILTWFALVGPSHPLFGLTVVVWTFGILPGIAGLIEVMGPHRWFHVTSCEHLFHRMLGVGIFDWILENTAYNRYVARPLRGFDGTRTGLASLQVSLQTNASAHAACFVIHILLATVAVFSGYTWSAALWILLPGFLVHVYPVLLQRSIMLRVQPLLERLGRPGGTKLVAISEETTRVASQ